jgi:hypothetical protein
MEADEALGTETQRTTFQALRRSTSIIMKKISDSTEDTGLKIKKKYNSFDGRMKARNDYLMRSRSSSPPPRLLVRDRYVTRTRSHESLPLGRPPVQVQLRDKKKKKRPKQKVDASVERTNEDNLTGEPVTDDEEESVVSIVRSMPQQRSMMALGMSFSDCAEHEASDEFELFLADAQHKNRSKKKKKKRPKQKVDESVVRTNEDNLTTGEPVPVTDDVIWSRSNSPPPPAGDRSVLRTRSLESLPLGRQPVQMQLQDEKKKKKKKRAKQKADASVVQSNEENFAGEPVTDDESLDASVLLTDENSLTGEPVTDDESSTPSQERLEITLGRSKYFV